MLRLLDRHAIGQLLRTKGIDAWGVAANTPRLPFAPDYPTAISMLMRVDPLVVRGFRHGPTEEYAHEYFRLNVALDDASGTLVDALRVHGRAAESAPATMSGDVNGDVNGDQPFPHKAAATSAGLGWIGKTALFVSHDFGPAVRLATVFTDLELPPGEPVREGRCGACRDCVDACPAGCGRNVTWQAGMPRDELFDAGACRHQMSLFPAVGAQVCGICIAACPYTRA